MTYRNVAKFLLAFSCLIFGVLNSPNVEADPIFSTASDASKVSNAEPVLANGAKILASSALTVASAKSGFFQDESLQTYAQDQVSAQFWFCTHHLALGTHCVAAPIIPHGAWQGAASHQNALNSDIKLAQKELGIPSKITVATR